MASKLKLRVAARFLASIFNGVGTIARKDGLATYVDLDYTQVTQLTSFDATTENVMVQNSIDGSFARVTLGSILSASQTQQVKTSAGDVNVAATDGLIAINKGTGGATNVNFPLAASKVGGCLVADFKGDAGTNNITVNLTSPDTFSGGATSWIISGNTGSIFLRPIPGVGYAL